MAKLKHIKKSAFLILFISLVILGELFFLFYSKKEQLPPSNVADTKAMLNYWTNKIHKIGGKEAYTYLKETYKQTTPREQHTAAHLFGELLFNAEGIQALYVCDDSFAFGCYHTFFSSAILKHGVESVKTLDEICVKRYGPGGTGCQHGIGHGILEYKGIKNVAEAVELCSPIQRYSLIGCSSGVFMEYNLPQTGQRLLSENSIYAPCDSVSDAFKESCYYQLTIWWGNQREFTPEKLGQLCLGIKEKKLVDICFLGLGSMMTPRTGYNTSKIEEFCKKMPTTDAFLSCKAGAAWIFFSIPEHRPLAKPLCETTQNVEECLRQADLTGMGVFKQ